MRYRIWVGLGLLLLLVAVASCAAGRSNQARVGTPVPTKTLRPTFTHTPVKPTPVPPTATPVPPSATPETPTPTTEPTEPPTETPTPVPAAFTVTSATLNVRSGPGTNFPVVAKLSRGETFEITGKNPAGDWWQFPYRGQPAWVSAGMVDATGTESVEAAESIPAPPPTARPQPRPQQPAPKPAAPQPSASYRYALRNSEARLNLNDWITVWCRVARDISTGSGDSGTMRVLRGSEVLAEQAFQPPLHTANAGMAATSQFLYSQNCKIELRPPIDGTYTAYLIEGGQQISEPATFTVSGSNREFVIRWQPR